MIVLPDWHDPAYLQHGTPRQRAAYDALQRLAVGMRLAAFTPVLAGSIPLAIDVPGSDLDVLCHAADLDAFAAQVTDSYGTADEFDLSRTTKNDLPTVIARFEAEGFAWELFGQPRAVTAQQAYRHMVVEARLLALAGPDAAATIRAMKRRHLKTEPAFARYFGLKGDPYALLLELADLDDAALRARVGLAAE